MATTPVSSPAPEEQPSIGPLGRVFGMITSPKRTFEDIARKPSWLFPSVLLVVMSFIAVAVLVQRVDWREFMTQQIEKNPRSAQMSEEQKHQQIEGGAKYAPIFVYVFGVLGPITILLLAALLAWGSYSLLAGVNAGFPTSFSVIAHAFMTGLVSTPVFVLVLLLKPREAIDVENPVATNLAALLPEDTAKWLYALCKHIDVFMIWSLVLVAIGFAAVNPKKLKGMKSYRVVFLVWATLVVLHVGAVWAFS